MLANVKFKCFEELKMTRAEDDGVNYDYNKFLNDSSDDEKLVIKQADDDMNYQQAYSQTEIGIALDNVLALAGERLEQFQSPDYTDGEIVNAMDSMQIVKDYFLHSGEAVINNSQIAQDNID